MSWTMPIKQKATVQNKKENNWDCNCDSFRAKQQIPHSHFSVNLIVPFTPGILIILSLSESFITPNCQGIVSSYPRRTLLSLLTRELSGTVLPGAEKFWIHEGFPSDSPCEPPTVTTVLVQQETTQHRGSFLTALYSGMP